MIKSDFDRTRLNLDTPSSKLPIQAFEGKPAAGTPYRPSSSKYDWREGVPPRPKWNYELSGFSEIPGHQVLELVRFSAHFWLNGAPVLESQRWDLRETLAPPPSC